ncbi:MAG: CHAT domain-containing protein, partial [Actinomycetota bacterium]
RWLTAQDVLAMSLPGALVVLSACESGRQQPGQHREETIGLARSFLAAGAAAVVVSLWMTADQVTAELMQHFYRAVTDVTPATALRRAQTAVADDHPHPADWASFIIYGGSRR